MYRTQMNEQSPLRILEQSSHGGLGRGNLGVVMARAGVGKTTFLVHIALDGMLRDRKVFHVSLDTSVDHVRCWYDTVFGDLARAARLSDVAATEDLIRRNRIIQAFSLHGHGSGQSSFSVERLGNALDLLEKHVGVKPDVILIDAFDWNKTSDQELGALGALAAQRNVEVWLTALTHRHQTGKNPDKVPPPCDKYLRHISLVVFLQPVDK